MSADSFAQDLLKVYRGEMAGEESFTRAAKGVHRTVSAVLLRHRFIGRAEALNGQSFGVRGTQRASSVSNGYG